jgi:rod shape-determining protein MreC
LSQISAKESNTLRRINLSSSFKGFSYRVSFLLYFFLAAIFLVISSISPGFVGSAREFILDFSTPVLEVVAAPFHLLDRSIQDMTHMVTVREQVQELQKERLVLLNWKRKAEELNFENKKLREIINYTQDGPRDIIPARVVSNPGGVYLRNIILNAGKENGIKKEYPVTNTEGLLGRIIEVGNTSSRVLLITDINSRIPIVTERSGVNAILSGDNSDFPHLTYVYKTSYEDSPIELGERVFTSGYAGVFPPGIPIGVVVRRDDGEMVVHPFVDLDRLSFVAVEQYVPVDVSSVLPASLQEWKWQE